MNYTNFPHVVIYQSQLGFKTNFGLSYFSKNMILNMIRFMKISYPAIFRKVALLIFIDISALVIL